MHRIRNRMNAVSLIDLSARTALVTGGSRGVGANRLARLARRLRRLARSQAWLAVPPTNDDTAAPSRGKHVVQVKTASVSVCLLFRGRPGGAESRCNRMLCPPLYSD